MKKIFLLIPLLILFVYAGCDSSTDSNTDVQNKITAKSTNDSLSIDISVTKYTFHQIYNFVYTEDRSIASFRVSSFGGGQGTFVVRDTGNVIIYEKHIANLTDLTTEDVIGVPETAELTLTNLTAVVMLKLKRNLSN